MIKVTKLNGELLYVNPYEIEFIEETPDTVISLKTDKKVLVSEKADVVIKRMIEFYRLVNARPIPGEQSSRFSGGDDGIIGD